MSTNNFTICLLSLIFVSGLTQPLFMKVHALTPCPRYKVVIDKDTGASMVVAFNTDVSTGKPVWEGDASMSVRVPLENFQANFPSCFASIDPFVGISSSSSSSSLTAAAAAEPLVQSTTSNSVSNSVGDTKNSNIIALPYARNPPPGYDYCTYDTALTVVNGQTYCNNYAQFVQAEIDSTINPTHPDCRPPNCYPCAYDPTGLGVVAAAKGQQYCDQSLGVCRTFWVCVPNMGCDAHNQCTCGGVCAQNGPRPVAIGPQANQGFKQWFYISDAQHGIYNESTIGGGGHAGCCTFDPRFPICQFQNADCACVPGFTPLNDNTLTAQTYNIIERLKSLSSTYTRYAAQGTNYKCCTRARSAAAVPAYFFDAYDRKEYIMRYTMSTICLSSVDTPQFNGVTNVLYSATASKGRSNIDSPMISATQKARIGCVRVWRDQGFTGVSAMFCTSPDGSDGIYGNLEWVARTNPNQDVDTWWSASYPGEYNPFNKGQWNADIRSWVVPANTRVTFYQDKWMEGKTAAHTNCECSNKNDNRPCCNTADWNISALKVQLL